MGRHDWIASSTLHAPWTVNLALHQCDPPYRTICLFKNSRRESKAGQIHGMNAIFRLFQDPADNVSVTINPLSQRDYVYPIIDNHPSGSFWYHGHKKGSAWFQVRHWILCNDHLLLYVFQWLRNYRIYKHEYFLYFCFFNNLLFLKCFLPFFQNAGYCFGIDWGNLKPEGFFQISKKFFRGHRIMFFDEKRRLDCINLQISEC